MGTTLALRYRNRFGKGLWVDVAMYQLGCSMVSDRILDWEANRRLGERIGNRHPWLAPQGCYRCAGDDQWCVVSVHDDEEWAALCRVIGRPKLARDPSFSSNEARMRNHDDIDPVIAEWMAGVSKMEAMERLQAAGVRAGAVFDARDMHVDPHARARGLLEDVQFPPERKIGTRKIIGRPWQLSKTPLHARGPGPMLGEHNREVLQGILGYDDAHYAEMEQCRHHRHTSDPSSPGAAHEHGRAGSSRAAGLLGPGLQGTDRHSGLRRGTDISRSAVFHRNGIHGAASCDILGMTRNRLQRGRIDPRGAL